MPEQPNLLVFVSDQHNPHVLGCYGDSVVRTPNLDALATRGVRFANNYCNFPLCVPSRMSFMTGQPCSDIEVWSNNCSLSSNVPTFAHALGAAGYETVLCGRMHFVGPDQRHGFMSRPIGDVGGSAFLGGKMPDLGHIGIQTAYQSYDSAATSGPGRTAYQAYDNAVTQAACQWLDARDRSGDERPWCLVVGYVLPHCPFICPKELYDYYYERIDVPTIPDGYLDELHPAVRHLRQLQGVDRLTAEQVRGARAAYYGLVEMTDRFVGRVVDKLASTQFDGSTAIMYTSDHGDMAGEHRMWWKNNFYDGSASVPMIWSRPGVFGEGRTVEAVTSLVNVAPTLTELGSAEPLPHAAAESLAGFLSADGGSVPDWPDVAYVENIIWEWKSPERMVRRGPWKLNHYHGYDRPQLFNLEEDPGEWVDRADDPSCATIRAELEKLVLTGWDGHDRMVQIMARRQRDRKTLLRWAQTVDPPNADYWPAPPGVNIFPET